MFLIAMRSVRSRLSALTLMLLAQQALALALAGALACCEQAEARAAAAMECCERGGDGHMCPLANRRAPDRGCRLKNGCSTGNASVLAGAGFVYAAPLVGRFTLTPPIVHPHARRLVVDEESLVNTPPATPPPKA
jgi:hypothetical protein